ncbi:MAG: twin-arginine translocase TatA/TatE family subunit [Chthoniobacter sp.]|uniref:Sec-independent protein translocase subunit TatA/TatB n=1 Tax=Chthoniobacter sp. TaxID=2510640 RepID=UPI0032A239F6
MNIASLFNLAGPDLIIILLIVLLLFGAKKLPELARGMGQAVREFTKAKDEFEREVTRPVEPAAPPAPAAKLDQPVSEIAHEVPHDVHDPHAEQTSETPHTHVS